MTLELGGSLQEKGQPTTDQSRDDSTEMRPRGHIYIRGVGWNEDGVPGVFHKDHFDRQPDKQYPSNQFEGFTVLANDLI